ncbi:MAG: adenylate/guanylate cyclase domain-containing protein [Rhodoplanes sp.]
MTPRREFLLRGPLRRDTWLASAAERLLFAGITSTDRLVRRRQLFTNIAAYGLALTAAVHFVSIAAHNFQGLLVVNAYNLLVFVFCALNHRLHAFGDLVAATTLIVGGVIGHLFVVFAVGTASDLQFYFTLAGFVLFLVGVENFRIFLALYALNFAALLVTFIFVPENGFVLPGDSELRRNLSIEAAMNAYLINGLLFSFALTAQYRAEERSEALLTSILPKRIAERLKEAPDGRIADQAERCSVLFIDLVGFTAASREVEPGQVVAYLDTIFSRVDAACERLGVDKIKTIGDSYMAVGGLSGDPLQGSRAIGLLALEFLDIIENAPALGDAKLQMRAGIHSGPVTAGVIGNARMTYDLWGDTVNVASRMESHGVPGRIHVSAAYKDFTAAHFAFEPRGQIEMKSVGVHATYFLLGALPSGEQAPS